MFIAPTVKPCARPVSRVPARIGIASPVSDKPMRRLKNRMLSPIWFVRPDPPPPPPPPPSSSRASASRASASAADTGAALLVPWAELEDAGILEKEVAFFRKQQAEACEVHLLLVGLDLREVGVDREVPGQAAGDAVFRVEAG